MTAPASFASVLLDRLAPFLTAEADPTGDHANYLIALAQCFEEMQALVMDGGDVDDQTWQPGYSILLDVDLCPTQYLPYLAQFNGTQIPAGSSDAVSRQIIRAESGMQRGKPSAIVAAAQRNLSGTQSVTVFERTAADGSTPDAYHFVLVVLTSEVIDATALTNAVDLAKPGGVLWTLIQTSTWTIAEFEAAYPAHISDAEAAFSTVSHLETDVLG